MNLYPHQKQALNKTLPFKRCAYYLDMGLGKTYVGSEKAHSFKKKVLLICQKSKIDDWITHYQTNYPLVPVFNLTKTADVRKFNQSNSYSVGVINYDLVYRRDQYLKLENFTLMLDESSIIQNETSQRCKYILKLRPENVILLSGTPTSGKYENLWSQLRLLGWNIDKQLYWNQYIDYQWEPQPGGFSIQKILGYKNVDRLKEKLRFYGAVFQKSEEVFDLPQQLFTNSYCEVSEEYKQFKKDRIITIDNKDLIGDTCLTEFLYSRMLCGCYSENKLKAFTDLVESTEDRLIVFYNFNAELFAMMNAIERPVSVVNGEDKSLECYEEYDNSITFVQYQAGAMGLNLQKANKIIYFSLPTRSELFEQSKKRIHRIGQNQTCFYYVMLCKGSIEEKILKTLEMRKDYTDELFREDFDAS